MSRAVYSTVFDSPARTVWEQIKDFNEDTWSGDVTKSWSENQMSGTAVGGIRVIRVGDKHLRQRLVEYSEPGMSYAYEFAGEPSMPVENFVAVLSVTPITDGDRSFLAWAATYDCDPEVRESSHEFFVRGCARWLAALRARLDT